MEGKRQQSRNVFGMQSWCRARKSNRKRDDSFGKRVLSLYVTYWPNFYQQCYFNQVFWMDAIDADGFSSQAQK